MATLKETKRRIKTAKNIGQVTRALEMVSAVKMRRAQEAALAGREYIFELEKMLQILSQNGQSDYGDFFHPRPIKKVTILLIGPQKGLVGPLAANLYRQLLRFFAHTARETIDGSVFALTADSPSFTLRLPKEVTISIVTVEKKARDIARLTRKPIHADFGHLGRQPTLFKVRPVADFCVDLYQKQKTDLVLLAYSHFVNTVTQKAVIRQYLPVLPVGELEKESELEGKELLFEPSAAEVVPALFTAYAEAVLYQTVLESLASEHSSRMVAMKNAHDNAAEIVGELTLEYNQTRQNTITNELADIVSGATPNQ